jgi:hypothetical protein
MHEQQVMCIKSTRAELLVSSPGDPRDVVADGVDLAQPIDRRMTHVSTAPDVLRYASP